MTLLIRQMRVSDAKRMHELYEEFCLDFVGCAKRELKQFRRISRKRDNTRWVATDKKGKIVGYIYAVWVKGRRTGRIIEIVTASEYDFKTVADPLVEKVCSIFLEKGAAQIQANTIQNRHYSEIFPHLGFQCIDNDGVFMCTITEISGFLDEITSIFVQRLGRLRSWSGVLRITCENQQRLFRKEGEKVQPISSTNSPVDCSIAMSANTLISLLLGAKDVRTAVAEKATCFDIVASKNADELLDSLFPRKQFLVLDYW